MTESKISPEGVIDAYALRNAWLKSEGSKHGIDPQKFLLGDRLRDITGDDGNFFIWEKWVTNEIFQNRADEWRREYQVRLAEEIATQGLPSEIIDRLESMQEIAGSADWTDKEQFYNVRGEYNLLARWVKEMVSENPELDESMRYSWENTAKVNELYLALSVQSKE